MPLNQFEAVNLIETPHVPEIGTKPVMPPDITGVTDMFDQVTEQQVIEVMKALATGALLNRGGNGTQPPEQNVPTQAVTPEAPAIPSPAREPEINSLDQRREQYVRHINTQLASIPGMIRRQISEEMRGAIYGGYANDRTFTDEKGKPLYGNDLVQKWKKIKPRIETQRQTILTGGSFEEIEQQMRQGTYLEAKPAPRGVREQPAQPAETTEAQTVQQGTVESQVPEVPQPASLEVVELKRTIATLQTTVDGLRNGQQKLEQQIGDLSRQLTEAVNALTAKLEEKAGPVLTSLETPAEPAKETKVRRKRKPLTDEQKAERSEKQKARYAKQLGEVSQALEAGTLDRNDPNVAPLLNADGTVNKRLDRIYKLYEMLEPAPSAQPAAETPPAQPASSAQEAASQAKPPESAQAPLTPEEQQGRLEGIRSTITTLLANRGRAVSSAVLERLAQDRLNAELNPQEEQTFNTFNALDSLENRFAIIRRTLAGETTVTDAELLQISDRIQNDATEPAMQLLREIRRTAGQEAYKREKPPVDVPQPATVTEAETIPERVRPTREQRLKALNGIISQSVKEQGGIIGPQIVAQAAKTMLDLENQGISINSDTAIFIANLQIEAQNSGKAENFNTVTPLTAPDFANKFNLTAEEVEKLKQANVPGLSPALKKAALELLKEDSYADVKKVLPDLAEYIIKVLRPSEPEPTQARVTPPPSQPYLPAS